MNDLQQAKEKTFKETMSYFLNEELEDILSECANLDVDSLRSEIVENMKNYQYGESNELEITRAAMALELKIRSKFKEIRSKYSIFMEDIKKEYEV